MGAKDEMLLYFFTVKMTIKKTPTKINKNLILIIGILILLVLVGCNMNGGGDRPITDVDVRKGTEGLVMGFTKNAPPERVFERSKDESSGIFPVGVELKNKGASDIENGILVFGFEKDYVDVADASGQLEDSGCKELNGESINYEKCGFDIKGKSIFNLEGDEEFIRINAQTKKIGAQSETQPSTILATACYQYNTSFGSSVCVDTDVYGIRKGKKACNIVDLQFSEGQGAPVTITKVETRMLPSEEDKIKPHFLIHVENKGNGEVINPEKDKEDPNIYIYEKACTSKPLKYTDFNTLKVNAWLSGVKLECNADDDLVRLKDKEDIIRCTLEEQGGIPSNRDAYTAPLKVELEYGYTFTISKDIIIEKILKY